MKKQANKISAAPLLVALGVVAVFAIGVIGFGIWNNDKPTSIGNTLEQQDAEVNAAPTIKNKEDLDTALRTMDEVDVAGSAVTDIDSEGNF